MVSGHSTHPDPSKNLIEIDPDKFALGVSDLGLGFKTRSLELVRFSV